MKIIFQFAIIFIFAGCNPQGSSKKEDHTVSDTTNSNSQVSFSHTDSSSVKQKEKTDTSLLMAISAKILALIKNRDYKQFSTFIHPKDSIRFSPYAYIDTTKDRSLSVDQFLHLLKQNKRINWNSSWDGEKPELLTVEGYFKKFIYDVNFLNAELKSINQYHSQGTDLNNIDEAYPGYNVVEFFFSGFEKKYDGLDFRGLRLVYKMNNNKPYLIGIIHDQWTP